MNQIFMKLMSFNYQKTLIIGVVLGAVYYFTLFDSGSAIDDQATKVQAEVAAEEVKAEEADRATKKMEKLKAQVLSLSEQYKVVATQIPTGDQQQEVLKLVESMATTSGIAIRGKTPIRPEKEDILERLPLRISADGSFSELTLFLFNMVNSERLTRIIGFSITSTPGRSSKGRSKLLMDVVLANYRFVGDVKEEAAGAKK